MDNRFPAWAIIVPWLLIVASEVLIALAFHQSTKGEAQYNQVLTTLILNSILLGLTTIVWGPQVLRATGLTAVPGVDQAAAALRQARQFTGGNQLKGGRVVA